MTKPKLTPLRWQSLSMAVAFLFAATCANAAITLGGSIQSESPDSRRVSVGGVFLPGDGDSGWWYYDWGDGTRTTAYFPAYHRYERPGDYTINIVGFNDLGETAVATLSHSVPAASVTDVAQVELARTFLGMKELDQRSVWITAYDASGNRLSLDGRNVELYLPISGVVDIALAGDSLQVNALDIGSSDARGAWAYVYVDKIECQKPLFVIVNSNTGEFTEVEGNSSGFYLPDWFFIDSYVPEEDHAHILDLAYDEFSWAINDSNESEGAPRFQGVSYAPAVYGVSGNPLLLGNPAAPSQGSPHFDVMFHEMGHNFHAYRNLFLQSGIASGALYQETLAEWHMQFAANRLLDLHSAQLSAPARASLISNRDLNRAYHEWEYQNYINGGMVFNFNSIMPSHVLVYEIYQLCDLNGWDRLRDFYHYFEIRNMARLSSVYGDFGGTSDVYRLSALVAVLGLTFDQDLRPVFVPLNFPIDDAFHDAVWNALMDRPPRANTGGLPMWHESW